MERQARSRVDSNPSGQFLPTGEFDKRPLADLEAVLWRPPPGWVAPEWLDDPYAPPTLPMLPLRLRWCLHAIGWSIGELSRRIHTEEASVRQMARGRREIRDTLAIWLETLVTRTLSGPIQPEGWRPKPMISDDGVPLRNPQPPRSG